MNDQTPLPLIERILVVGVSNDELKNINLSKQKEFNQIDLNPKNIEEYKSSNLKDSKAEYIDNIPNVYNN
jgi:hypothetical protein